MMSSGSGLVSIATRRSFPAVGGAAGYETVVTEETGETIYRRRGDKGGKVLY